MSWQESEMREWVQQLRFRVERAADAVAAEIRQQLQVIKIAGAAMPDGADAHDCREAVRRIEEIVNALGPVPK